MATTREEFALFPRLPPELRRAVWTECMPHRVIEVDAPNEVWQLTYCELKTTSRLNRRYPIITRVCRESRDVAFQTGYDLQRVHDAEGWKWQQWLNPATDIVHMSYRKSHIAHCKDAKSVSVYLKEAGKGVEASIDVNTLHGLHASWYDGRAQLAFDLLGCRRNYLVNLKTFNVHVNFDQAASSGLFGSLVEERIKLVDAFDKKVIQQYHQLWSSGPQKDREPATFFELALSTDSFEKRIQRWRDEVETVWLLHKWHRAMEKGFVNIEEPEKIWLEHKTDEHGNFLDILDGGPPGLVKPETFQTRTIIGS
jgi:hypothetical protein